MCSVFYLGYFQVFVSFLGAIKHGGCGKNGSTVAVRFPVLFIVVGVGFVLR